MASRARPEMMGFRLSATERKEVELASTGSGHENLAAYLREVVLADARRRLRARVLADSAVPAPQE